MTEAQRIDFTTFILSIGSAAYMGMGIVPLGVDLKPQLNLELARQNIDLLQLIEEKTKGNRTPDEDRLLTHLLFETRMKYVEMQKKPTLA